MGYWFETDMVSQLPILGGDKIRLFVLVKRKSTGKFNEDIMGYCTINSLWKPIGSILGEYNDFGGLQNIKEDVNSEALFDCLEKYYDKPVKNVDDFVNFFDDIDAHSQQSIETVQNDRKYNIGFCFVLEELYNCMKWNNPKSSGESITDRILKDINGWYAQELTTKEENQDFHNLSSLIDFHELSIFDVPTINYLRKLRKDFISKGIDLKESTEAQAIVNEIIMHIMFQYGLSASRKGWQPQFGRGAQIGESLRDMRIYKLILQTTHKVLAKRKKNYIKNCT